MLTHPEARKLMHDFLPKLNQALCLSGWEILWELKSLEDAKAQTDLSQLEYRRVTVALDPQRHTDESDFIVTLRHELFHLLPHSYDHFCEQAFKLVRSEETANVLNEALRQARELFVTHMELVFDRDPRVLMFGAIAKETRTMAKKGSKKGSKGKPMNMKFEGGKPKKGKPAC